MPSKHKYKVAITQMTSNGAFVYKTPESYHGEAEFTSTYNHCYFNNITLKKIKGGAKGGNYKDVDSNEIYRVMKFDKL